MRTAHCLLSNWLHRLTISYLKRLQWRKVWKKRWVALHGMEIVYMDKEPTSKNMSDITITKAQFTGASTVKEEDPDNDPTGFVINVRVSLLFIPRSFLTFVFLIL